MNCDLICTLLYVLWFCRAGIHGVCAFVTPALVHDQFTCSDPPEKGPCNESYTHYYFNTQNKTCQEFIYGGCEGNVNNYETIEECRVSCELRPRPICYLPKKRGACSSRFPRYFYNATSETCEQFFYSGCKGNANNFREIEECLRICSKDVEA
ncbi:BPTI/Kunitz domain-containing protein-like [Dermacentor silvarum]|uniref:BPTI/Kunitz domain-containing protein-like n=1 Tax=Dermacentor silvarum TaxID=543639 RepID=UPI0021008B48|nr:BPTI/Kunitz domain-containing protein-like [Dermacentor silvarum]